jgi:hypothetical protein
MGLERATLVENGRTALTFPTFLHIKSYSKLRSRPNQFGTVMAIESAKSSLDPVTATSAYAGLIQPEAAVQ